MFRRLSEPLPLSEASLLVLRPALNAPVLNVEFLPVGPAKAALVVFAEEYGGIGLAFGIRSVEGGQVAVLRNQEPIDESAPLAELLEPALAEAERMGFLFDEDMVSGSAGRGRAGATELWAGLMGDLEGPGAEDLAAAEADKAAPVTEVTEVEEATELVLEEVAPDALADFDDAIEEIELDLETSSASGPDRSQSTMPMAPSPEAPAAARRVSAKTKTKTKTQTKAEPRASAKQSEPPAASKLSKFRHVEVTSEDARGPGRGKSDPDAGGAASKLGRIALKRVRNGRGIAKRIPYVSRLLSSF